MKVTKEHTARGTTRYFERTTRLAAPSNTVQARVAGGNTCWLLCRSIHCLTAPYKLRRVYLSQVFAQAARNS